MKTLFNAACWTAVVALGMIVRVQRPRHGIYSPVTRPGVPIRTDYFRSALPESDSRVIWSM